MIITILTLAVACIAISQLLLVWTIQRIELQNRSRLDALLVRLRRLEPDERFIRMDEGPIQRSTGNNPTTWWGGYQPRPQQGTPNPTPSEP
jgi:hypothetical protein